MLTDVQCKNAICSSGAKRAPAWLIRAGFTWR